ncbi:MAG TPA: hypothetical protein VHS99_15525 [Chloroflexota bacterium]|nr:hypothetical protein [Chloroflexota bacterium]
MRAHRSSIVVTALLVLLATIIVAPTVYAQPPQQAFSNGTVIALSGTPHLWIAGEDGTLHWAGDTRAIGDRFVDWAGRREVTLDQLRSYRRGDPYLSAGLVKIGDPIYLAKWETNQTAPTLLHIQSISDVELFGINAENYGRFVLDRAAWEQRYTFNTDTLSRGVLSPAVPPTATPTPAVTATPQVRMAVREIHRKKNSDTEWEVKVEVTGALPRTRLYVSADIEEWICSPACTDTRRVRWGPIEAGMTNNEGRLEWTDKHGPYKGYTYTFDDQMGNRVSIGFSNDL